jgi:hypothetical protein
MAMAIALFIIDIKCYATRCFWIHTRPVGKVHVFPHIRQITMLTAANELPNSQHSAVHGRQLQSCMMSYITDALFICCRKLTSVKVLFVDARVDN